MSVYTCRTFMLSKRNRRYIISIVYLCNIQPFLTSLSFTWRHFRKSSSTHFFGFRTKATSASRKERRTTSTGTSCTTVRGCPTSSRPTRDNWSTSTSPSPNPMVSSAWFHRAPCSSACCESRRLFPLHSDSTQYTQHDVNRTVAEPLSQHDATWTWRCFLSIIKFARFTLKLVSI